MTYQAGRDLDALVAEKVMGLIPIQETFESHHNGDAVTVTKWCLEDGNQIGEYGFCPRYSTSIEAAWEVVRKMGMVLIENSGEAFGQPDEWNVQFVGRDSEGEPHWVSAGASTCELAICLAAMKAVGF